MRDNGYKRCTTVASDLSGAKGSVTGGKLIEHLHVYLHRYNSLGFAIKPSPGVQVSSSGFSQLAYC